MFAQIADKEKAVEQLKALNLKKQENARKEEVRKVDEEARKVEEEARQVEERKAEEARKAAEEVAEEVGEPAMKSPRCEPVKEAIKFIQGLSGSSGDAEASDEALLVSAMDEALFKKLLRLEVQAELFGLKLARRDETIRTLKAALAAADVPLPPMLDTQQSQENADEMSPVEQLWLEPSNEDDDE